MHKQPCHSYQDFLVLAEVVSWLTDTEITAAGAASIADKRVKRMEVVVEGNPGNVKKEEQSVTVGYRLERQTDRESEVLQREWRMPVCVCVCVYVSPGSEALCALL